MTDRNASTRAAQARTLVIADNWGEPWDGEEIALVVEFSEDSAEELAVALGRTVYAVHAMREALRKGERVGGGQRRVTERDRLAMAWAPDDPRWDW